MMSPIDSFDMDLLQKFIDSKPFGEIRIIKTSDYWYLEVCWDEDPIQVISAQNEHFTKALAKLSKLVNEEVQKQK